MGKTGTKATIISSATLFSAERVHAAACVRVSVDAAHDGIPVEGTLGNVTRPPKRDN